MRFRGNILYWIIFLIVVAFFFHFNRVISTYRMAQERNEKLQQQEQQEQTLQQGEGKALQSETPIP